MRDAGWVLETFAVKPLRSCQQASDHLLVVVDYVVSCPADLSLDGDVGIVDFLALLGAWGPCDVGGGCSGDLEGEGQVGITDFLKLLANWSTHPLLVIPADSNPKGIGREANPRGRRSHPS